MGKTFRTVVLCSTNDHLPAKNDKIRGWVEHNGGKYTKELTDDVTHVLASKQSFKENKPIIQMAQRMPRVKIVELGWLEDSLCSKTRRPRKTTQYEFNQRKLKKSAFRETDGAMHRVSPDTPSKKETGASKKSQGASVKKSKSQATSKIPPCQQNELVMSKAAGIEELGTKLDRISGQFEQEMIDAGYHIYRDSTGFPYSVNIVRKDILKRCLERHRLKVRCAPMPFSASNFPQSPNLSPLFYFPETYPFSRAPAISGRLPRRLRQECNPDLRVHVFDPWAQCLQFFESDSMPRRYTAFSTYLDLNGHVHKLPVAAEGSMWELARDLFVMYFRNRCGIEWEAGARAGGVQVCGSDGGRGQYVYEPPAEGEPKRLRRFPRKLSMTTVVDEQRADDIVDTSGNTPEGRW